MPGMYPDDQLLEIFGEQVMYPGLDPETHKFTDGDFSDPLKKPSHIPAATFNLLIDNMENLISEIGLDPNNTDPEQLKKAMQKGFAPRRVGELVMLAYEPSVEQLIKMHLLPLKGEIFKIELYQDLFDLMYVGDDNNNNALWWYRCNIDGTRSITGLYFRLLDISGLFPRAAGQNSYYRTNMNNPLSTPYDGNAIGTYQSDAVRSHLHTKSIGVADVGNNLFGDVRYWPRTDGSVTNTEAYTGYYGDSETKPVSFSVLVCITY